MITLAVRVARNQPVDRQGQILPGRINIPRVVIPCCLAGFPQAFEGGLDRYQVRLNGALGVIQLLVCDDVPRSLRRPNPVIDAEEPGFQHGQPFLRGPGILGFLRYR